MATGGGDVFPPDNCDEPQQAKETMSSCASELSGLQGLWWISPRRRGIETMQPARRVASLEVAMSRKGSQGGLEDTTGRNYRETNLGNVANPKP
jgi:hypothetical protein